MNVKSSACAGTLLAIMLIAPSDTVADIGSVSRGDYAAGTAARDTRVWCQLNETACVSPTQAVLRAPDDVEYQTRADLVQPNQSQNSGRTGPAPVVQESKSAPKQSEMRE